MRIASVASALLCLLSPVSAAETAPRSLDPALRITLFAENPQLVTPTGIDVDAQGRVWAIESNTHFPPKDYKGHPSDRLLILTDTNGDGRADREQVFLDGLRHTMSVAVRPAWIAPVRVDDKISPAERQVFVATRREILLLEDTDNDDRCDRQTRLAWLETRGDYPHNGLAGFAFDALGWLYFGFGENLGEAYTLSCRGSGDEGKLAPFQGGGEGGNVYRMHPDGTDMAIWSTGFWNPHASCFDGAGRLFTVDNDPDSRPPCRLLHLIPGGDYGYRFRNGRKGLHPFTSWNGEVPGTLPMVAGTGEAPSGILAYEHDAFPVEYRGNLIVTSWGDHRIDRFRLKAKGASVESVPEPFIVGGEEFRPVGIALAPDGSLYCTDWVKRDYQLHGHGRVWRIAAADPAKPAVADDPKANLSSPRLSTRRVAARTLAATPQGRDHLLSVVVDQKGDDRARREALWGLASAPADAITPPLLQRKPILIAVAEHPEDDVFAELKTLTELPQVSYPEREHADLKINEKFGPLDLEGGRALYGAVRSTPAALRMKVTGANLAGVMYLLGMASPDPFVSAAAIDELSRADFSMARIQERTGEHSPVEIANWAVLARKRDPRDVENVRLFLQHPAPLVRRVAVQWAGEERLTELRSDVEKVLSGEAMSTELFLATLASLEMLDGKPPQEFDKTPPGKYVLPLLANPKSTDGVRIQSLKLISATPDAVPFDQLRGWASSANRELALEATRTLATSANPAAGDLLLELGRSSPEAGVRLDALAGLARLVPASPELRDKVFAALKEASDPQVRTELLRTLRGAASDAAVRKSLLSLTEPDSKGTAQQRQEWADQLAIAFGTHADELPAELRKGQSSRPGSIEAWEKLLETSSAERPGDAARGRRVFFHSEGPGCVKCHLVDGRGGEIGPNLTRIGGSMSRKKLIESILEPSKEVSPQFTSWTMVSTSGQVYTGMIVHENEGKTVLGDAAGKLVEVKTADVEERVPQKTSVMPEKLADRLTVQEFFDLVAFLESLR